MFTRLFVSSLLVCQNVHAHSHLCCLFPSACVCARVCVSLCVCIVPFQVASASSIHPTVRPKKTSQSLTACALPPLSPLVLTHVFLLLLTRSLCCFSPLVSELMPPLEMQFFSGAQADTHVSSWYVNIPRPEQRQNRQNHV